MSVLKQFLSIPKRGYFMKNLLALIMVFTTMTAFAQGTYNINTKETKVEWHGRKVAGPHNGHILVKSGNLTIDSNLIKSGSIVMDMNSITNEDVTGEWNAKLVGHLKDADFFDVTKYPESKLVIKSSKMNGKNMEISADMTIKGITKPITFTATDIQITANSFSAKSEIKIDRTEFGIVYSSAKGGFDVKALGDKLIYDEFTLKVSITAKK